MACAHPYYSDLATKAPPDLQTSPCPSHTKSSPPMHQAAQSSAPTPPAPRAAPNMLWGATWAIPRGSTKAHESAQKKHKTKIENHNCFHLAAAMAWECAPRVSHPSLTLIAKGAPSCGATLAASLPKSAEQWAKRLSAGKRNFGSTESLPLQDRLTATVVTLSNANKRLATISARQLQPTVPGPARHEQMNKTAMRDIPSLNLLINGAARVQHGYPNLANTWPAPGCAHEKGN